MSSRKAFALPPGRARRLAGLAGAPLAVLALAGCGDALVGGSGLRVQADAQSLHTGEQLHLTAFGAGSDEPAQVRWRITASNNAAILGSGSISPDGVYTPPAMLSRDVVTVTIAAGNLDAGAAATAPATATFSITPGFVQPLQPENATVVAGGRLEVRAQLAEVGSGSVHWQIAGADAASRQLGTLSGQHCDRSPRQFTTCTVTYTAPPPGSPEARLWLIAGTGGAAGANTRARILVGPVASDPTTHQAEQRGPIALGGSGGNDNDFDTFADASGTRLVADCCGGTLGALLEDQAGTPYILSNNHVLATSDQARVGDTIEQPGLIDDGCMPLSHAGAQLHAVGSLKFAVRLQSSRRTNVDAALASVLPGAIDGAGVILELGEATPAAGALSGSLGSAPPMAGAGERLDAARLTGLAVVKSGRTTGLTCSTVDALDLRVAVDYYRDCAETQPYTTKVFTGQIGIGGDSFADSGDSGALVLDAANAQPIGLLYATATTHADASSALNSPGALNERLEEGLSLANPIGDVLTELGAAAGAELTVRGTNTPHSVACINYSRGATPAWPSLSDLAPDERTRALAAVEQAASLPGVLAASAGASEDDPGHAAVLLYLDSSHANVPVPATVAGVRTVVIPGDLATIARGPASWAAPVAHPGLQLSPATLAAGRALVDRLAAQLMQAPAVFGVGLAQSLDSPRDPALLLLIDSDAPILRTAHALQAFAAGPSEGSSSQAQLPAFVEGMRTRYLRMHRFHVTRSKYLAPGTASSCSVRALSPER